MVYGVGYIGQGKYKSKTNIFHTWRSMLRRCYSEVYQAKKPTYIGCVVDEHWHCFQNFAQWYEKNYIEGFELDKDILCKGCKVYSESTCCFVPHEINSLFVTNNLNRGNCLIGVYKSRDKFRTAISKQGKNIHLGKFDTEIEAFKIYKFEKEKYIKELAEKWKGLLNTNVYNTMVSYSIEIDD